MFELGFPYELYDKVHKVFGKMNLKTYNNLSHCISSESINRRFVRRVYFALRGTS